MFSSLDPVESIPFVYAKVGAVLLFFLLLPGAGQVAN